MYRWRVHTTLVVSHTLHRGQRDTRLCPYLAIFDLLYYSLPLSQRRSLPHFPPSMFPPTVVRVCSHRCPLPFHYQLYTCLIPPQHPHPHRWFSIRLPTQVQNLSCSYELPDHVLPTLNIFFSRLESSLFSSCSLQGVFPFSVVPSMWESPCQPLRHLVQEPPQVPGPCGG